MKKLTSFFLVFIPSICFSQQAVYDAAAFAAITEGNETMMAKQVEMVNQLTTMVNTANKTLERIQKADEELLKMNSGLRCAFTRTSDMLQSVDQLERKVSGMLNGEIFNTTQQLLGLVNAIPNSGSGRKRFNSVKGLVDYVDNNYTGDGGNGLSPAMVLAYRKDQMLVIDKSLNFYRKQKAILASEYAAKETERLNRQWMLSKALASESGEECAAAQAGSANRILLEGMAAQDLIGMMQALDAQIQYLEYRKTIIYSGQKL